MKKIRNLFAAALSVCVLLSFASCVFGTNPNGDDSSSSSKNNNQENNQDNDSNNNNNNNNSSKTTKAYFASLDGTVTVNFYSDGSFKWASSKDSFTQEGTYVNNGTDFSAGLINLTYGTSSFSFTAENYMISLKSKITTGSDCVVVNRSVLGDEAAVYEGDYMNLYIYSKGYFVLKSDPSKSSMYNHYCGTWKLDSSNFCTGTKDATELSYLTLTSGSTTGIHTIKDGEICFDQLGDVDSYYWNDSPFFSATLKNSTSAAVSYKTSDTDKYTFNKDGSNDYDSTSTWYMTGNFISGDILVNYYNTLKVTNGMFNTITHSNTAGNYTLVTEEF